MLQNRLKEKSVNQRLPKQNSLPSHDQLRSLYNDMIKSPGRTVEIPFFDSAMLTITRKFGEPSCNWKLTTWCGLQGTEEWSYDSNDPRWVSQQLVEFFPKYNHHLKQR